MRRKPASFVWESAIEVATLFWMPCGAIGCEVSDLRPEMRPGLRTSLLALRRYRVLGRRKRRVHGEATLVGKDRLLEEEVGERGQHDGNRERNEESNELIFRAETRMRQMLPENVDHGFDEDM